MELYKIAGNEAFFTNMLKALSEEGKWVWKDHPHLVFTKRGDRLVGTEEGVEMVKEIVSTEFLEKHFALSE